MAREFTIGDPDGVLEATFVPELGMVGVSLRHEGEELLHQGDGLKAYADHGSTFGLPLLHPWANRLSAWEFELAGQRVALDPASPITHRDAATGTPIHGLLTASPHWKVSGVTASTLSAELDFGAVPEYLAAFPFPHHLQYTATVGADNGISGTSLEVRLRVKPTRDVAVPVAFGFHPYLTLPGSDRRGWRLELPVARQTLVDRRMLPTGATIAISPGELDGVLAERTFDTGFDRLREPAPTFAVADDRRHVVLSHVAMYPVAQVYAPEGSNFVCFEPMTAPVNALVSGDGLRWVAPEATFEAIFRISVDLT